MYNSTDSVCVNLFEAQQAAVNAVISGEVEHPITALLAVLLVHILEATIVLERAIVSLLDRDAGAVFVYIQAVGRTFIQSQVLGQELVEFSHIASDAIVDAFDEVLGIHVQLLIAYSCIIASVIVLSTCSVVVPAANPVGIIDVLLAVFLVLVGKELVGFAHAFDAFLAHPPEAGEDHLIPIEETVVDSFEDLVSEFACLVHLVLLIAYECILRQLDDRVNRYQEQHHDAKGEGEVTDHPHLAILFSPAAVAFCTEGGVNGFWFECHSVLLSVGSRRAAHSRLWLWLCLSLVHLLDDPLNSSLRALVHAEAPAEEPYSGCGQYVGDQFHVQLLIAYNV